MPEGIAEDLFKTSQVLSNFKFVRLVFRFCGKFHINIKYFIPTLFFFYLTFSDKLTYQKQKNDEMFCEIIHPLKYEICMIFLL